MALSDPLLVHSFDVVDGTAEYAAKHLPLVVAGENKASYGAPDSPLRVTVSHSYGKRTRRTVRLDVAKEAPNTWIPSQNSRYTMSTYIVIDEPVSGFSDDEINRHVMSLINLLAESGSVAAGPTVPDQNLDFIIEGVS